MSAVVVAVLVSVATWRILVRRPVPRRCPDGPAARDRAPAVGPRADGRVAGPHPLLVRSGRSGAARSVRPAAVGCPAAATADLAVATDLLAVAVSAGLSLPVAVAAVGASGSGPAARAFADVAAAVQRGVPFDRALEHLEVGAGDDARSLRTTLATAATSGAAVGATLRHQAERLRRRRRRRLEQRIRRLPVLLVLPLCACILPAFVVVTIVPVARAAVDQLDLGAVDRR